MVGRDNIYRGGIDVISLRKRMGMVFQKPNPFAMSIFDNVVYPLRVDGISNRHELDEACERALRARRCGTRPRTGSRTPRWGFRAASSSGCASRAPSLRTPKCC
jgi:ABC-type transporter Mla maintaining outer membrane lipid asymmetry ATPase subunit MlaF